MFCFCLFGWLVGGGVFWGGGGCLFVWGFFVFVFFVCFCLGLLFCFVLGFFFVGKIFSLTCQGHFDSESLQGSINQQLAWCWNENMPISGHDLLVLVIARPDRQRACFPLVFLRHHAFPLHSCLPFMSSPGSTAMSTEKKGNGWNGGCLEHKYCDLLYGSLESNSKRLLTRSAANPITAYCSLRFWQSAELGHHAQGECGRERERGGGGGGSQSNPKSEARWCV